MGTSRIIPGGLFFYTPAEPPGKPKEPPRNLPGEPKEPPGNLPGEPHSSPGCLPPYHTGIPGRFHQHLQRYLRMTKSPDFFYFAPLPYPRYQVRKMFRFSTGFHIFLPPVPPGKHKVLRRDSRLPSASPDWHPVPLPYPRYQVREPPGKPTAPPPRTTGSFRLLPGSSQGPPRFPG